MHRLTAWVLASPAWAAAQVTTSLVLPCIFEPQIIASVMTAASDATTYFLTCPPQVTTSAKGCVLDPGVIFTEGPSTVQWWQTTKCVIFFFFFSFLFFQQAIKRGSHYRTH